MDYFTLFNLPKQFQINQKLLAKNFYTLQSKFHPDLFIYDTNLKKNSFKKSIELNTGYKTLKDFLSRAIYLLDLKGFKINTDTVLLNHNHFLTKYFSLYEEIDHLKKNCFNQENWENIIKKVINKIENCQKNIELEFEKENYKNIIFLIEKLLFLRKIKFNLQKERNLFLRQEN
ncbi:Fe-S protein assembly co-chaperone HscB [Buchnera aphidicola]|uniref:Co-chaperone protein HscB n=1 Tax=Buchnera aphidicola str. Ua (Uroleucon ambrosiae) TaxID=1005057 RepID=G2LNP4_BUCUM|nr:Fe-S protein assembly co-chaperone HscB [Buchnera aphidicola]AEO08360.1 chaperone protein HscB [Buchnera aphidicola str. Ua (Uroleucon ambrosiae)]